jgi:hypothetical protein
VYKHLFFLALFEGCRALPASTNNSSVKLKMSTEQGSTGCLAIYAPSRNSTRQKVTAMKQVHSEDPEILGATIKHLAARDLRTPSTDDW